MIDTRWLNRLDPIDCERPHDFVRLANPAATFDKLAWINGETIRVCATTKDGAQVLFRVPEYATTERTWRSWIDHHEWWKA